jgi:hypothetical protein
MAAILTPEEYQQAKRSLIEKTLDRAASDPEWKQQYLDNPDEAVRNAGFEEYQRIEETRQQLRRAQPSDEEDVRGHDFVYVDSNEIYIEDHIADHYRLDHSVVYYYYQAG